MPGFLAKATASSLAEVCLWPTAYVGEQHKFRQEVARMRGCAGSPESLLFAYAIKALFAWRGSNIV